MECWCMQPNCTNYSRLDWITEFFGRALAEKALREKEPREFRQRQPRETAQYDAQFLAECGIANELTMEDDQ